MAYLMDLSLSFLLLNTYTHIRIIQYEKKKKRKANDEKKDETTFVRIMREYIYTISTTT